MNKKIYVIMGALLLAAPAAIAQQKVKDGTVTGSSSLADANAVLEVESSNKGLLLPRVALTGTAATAPLTAHIAGMTVYNTATAGDVTPGYYYNDGTQWVRLANAATNNEPWYSTITHTGATANTDSMYMMGKVGIGTSTPQRSLHIVSPVEGSVPGWDYTKVGSRDALLLENNNNVNIGFIGTAQTGLKFYKGNTVGNDMGYILYDRPTRLLCLGTDYQRIGGTTANFTDIAIDSLGNVGIGTSRPQRKLHVVSETGEVGKHGIISQLSSDDTAYAGVFEARRSLGTSTAPTAVTAGTNLSNFRTVGYNGSAWKNNAQFVFAAAEDFTSTANGTYLRLELASPGQTVPSEKVHFTANGNVGIGTQTPTSKLQVVGIPYYDNDAAAGTAGLTAGAFWQTASTNTLGLPAGVLMVKQ